MDDGAAIIDVGGESGVTNRPPIPVDEEIRRVVPVVRKLAGAGAIISVDTWKPEVARAVLDAGAHIINDVSGLRRPEIARQCAEFGAGLVLMHTRAEPKVKAFPSYEDVMADVMAFLKERMDEAVTLGLQPEQLVLDPGPDFAKTRPRPSPSCATFPSCWPWSGPSSSPCPARISSAPSRTDGLSSARPAPSPSSPPVSTPERRSFGSTTLPPRPTTSGSGPPSAATWTSAPTYGWLTPCAGNHRLRAIRRARSGSPCRAR